mgnify:CR=1 FL=1
MVTAEGSIYTSLPGIGVFLATLLIYLTYIHVEGTLCHSSCRAKNYLEKLVNRLRKWNRWVVLPLLVTFLFTLCPAQLYCADNKTEETESNKESVKESALNFTDKWLINGNAIGNAIGAVVGQMLLGMVFAGPIGLVIGSGLGSLIGGYIGAGIDDRTGIAVNYTAFNRPPLTQGGTWLKNVGPWEQFFYQVDAWVLNGGSLAGLSCHFMMNFMARTIPGLGLLANPVLLAVCNYIVATFADNMDGLVDLGSIGKKIDDMKGLSPTVGTTGPTTEANGRPPINFTFRDAYNEVIYQMRHGTQDSIKQAYDGFKNVKEALNDVIETRRQKREAKEAAGN